MSVLEWSVAVSNGVTAAGWRHEGSWQNQTSGPVLTLTSRLLSAQRCHKHKAAYSPQLTLNYNHTVVCYCIATEINLRQKKQSDSFLQKEGNNDPKTPERVNVNIFKFSPLHFILNVGTCNFYTLAGHAAPVLAEETDAFMLELCSEGNLHRNLWGNWKPLSAFY